MNITGGKYNSLKVDTAKYSNIKPTLSKIRQAVFNTIFSEGNFQTFCDLYAGSGIMTFEAASRGYDVTTLEIDRKTAASIKQNAEKLKININLQCVDTLKYLMKWDKKFDIFYLDPPYYSDLYDKTLKIIENKSLLNTNGLIILEKPSSVIVDLGSFLCVKEKKYGDKLIQYLKNRE